jgi:xanthine dehydrogenase small subunit
MNEPTRPIRFLLGDEARELSGVDPNMTVLNYLRLQERRRGTKEGCGEGDCGACTVVLGSLEEGRLVYRAVNACIQLIGTLDGKQLLTVEDLAEGEELHPCQQAMVDAHGSQCGFCTPGFVMSLFALYHGQDRIDRNRIDDALAGNLCRCTGYGPIIAAAGDMRASGALDRFVRHRGDTVSRLRALGEGKTALLEGAGSTYFAPRSAAQLAALLQRYPDATILAGGTDVGLWITKQLRRLNTIIYVGEAADLKQITVGERWLEIGAAVTYSEALDTIAAHYPDLAMMTRRLGSEQIRNAGTIGGNIANGSPIGDFPPPLIALGSRLVLRRGDRYRELPLEEYFIEYGRQDRQPGEFVAAVRLPIPNPPGSSPAKQLRCYKISKRFDQDISAVLGAFALTLEAGRVQEIRICFGGMAGTPKRAMEAEAAINGKPWTRETVEAACLALAQDYQPIGDMRASATYRRKVAANLLRKFFLETTTPGEPGQTLRISEVRRAAHAHA